LQESRESKSESVEATPVLHINLQTKAPARKTLGRDTSQGRKDEGEIQSPQAVEREEATENERDNDSLICNSQLYRGPNN
jgi:hypothetical protein